MANKHNSNLSIVKRLYNTLVSMKFAIIILIILGATSLLSMLINEYPAFFAKNSFLNSLFQQHSPYSSWWYSIMLGLMIISVLLCVIQNIKPTIKAIIHISFLKTESIKNMGNSKHIKISNIDTIKRVLKKQQYHIVESDDGKLFFARKFRWSAFGHILTHISLLVIVLGSLIYTKTDRQEFRYLIAEEYRETEYFQNFPDLFKWHFKVTETEHPTMIVDSFRVRYYDEGHGPSISDFRSYVRLLDHDGTLLKQHEVTVNSPLIYKHVSIHQSDYKPLVDEFFQNSPNRRQIIGNLQNQLERIHNETNWITGLSLRANKGKPVIFLGMLISVIGLIMAFMFWPRSIWVAVNNDTATIGGRSPKNKIAFQDELDNIIKRINNE